MTAARRPATVRPPASVWVMVAGGLLALVVWVSGQAYLRAELRLALDGEQQRASLLAQSFESHLSGLMSALDQGLGTLAALSRLDEEGGAGLPPPQPERQVARQLSPWLLALVRQSPRLRSVSLLDAQGRVWASSSSANVGLTLAWPQLGFARELGAQMEVGALLPVRDLSSLAGSAEPGQAAERAQAGISALPLGRRLPGTALMLVALLNPSHLFPDRSDLLGQAGHYAWVLNYDGQVLGALGAGPLTAGARAPQLPLLAPLRQDEQTRGAYRAQGLDRLDHERDLGESGIYRLSYRSAQAQPLAVVVALSEAGFVQDWTTRRGWLVWLPWLWAVLVLGLTAVFVRLLQHRERAASALHQAHDHAAQASAAKSAFLRNISHEVRTPINSMLGLTELVLASRLAPRQREHLTQAHQATLQLLRLVDEVLDYSRSEAGELSLEPGDLDVQQLCQHLVRDLQPTAADKGLALVLDIDPAVPQWVRADGVRLRQVLAQLLDNAIKVSTEGQVSVRVRSGHPPWTLAFEVVDTGPGLSPEQQAHLFQAFELTDMGLARRHGGKGLGLALCRHLVALMGGQWRVDSTPGRGTCMGFTCQLAAPLQPPPPRPLWVERVPWHVQPLLVLSQAPGPEADAVSRWLSVWRLPSIGAHTADELLRRLSHVGQGQSLEPTVLLLDAALLTAGLQKAIDEAGARLPGGLWVVLMQAVRDGALLNGWTPTPARWQRLDRPLAPAALQDALYTAFRHLTGLARIDEDLPEQDGLPPQRPPSLHALPTPPGAVCRVLVVDDTPMNRQLARLALEKLGVVVDTADDGGQAVSRLAAPDHGYDLVLMDLQMPVMDGLEATRRIRLAEKARQAVPVPIVAITAHGAVQDKQACLGVGMNDFLRKPIAAQAYQDLLARLPSLRQTGSAVVRSAAPAQSLSDITMPPTPPAALPLAYLDPAQALEYIGEADQVHTMLLMLDESLSTELGQLDTLIAEGELTGANRLLHPLKGFMPIFCQPALAQQVADTEALSKGQDAAALRQAWAALGPALRGLHAEIKAELARSGA